MRKLLYVANHRIPTEKAHGVQIMRMCQAFSELDLDVTLLIPRRRNPITKTLAEYYSVQPKFRIVKLFTIDLIGMVTNVFALQAYTFYSAALLYINGHRDSETIIYTRDYLFGLFYKGHILEVHALPKNLSAWKKRLFARAALIVCLTPFIKEKLMALGVSSEKLLVAADAVDLASIEVKETKEECRRRLSLPVDKQIVAYIGKYKTLEQGKGVDELINSFPRVIESHAKAHLLIVGVQPAEKEIIENKAREIGLMSDAITVIPHVPLNEVKYYFASADIFIMNFPWSEHYAYYMSPMKLYEYMAAKRPIVATDLPTIRTILNDTNACIIPPDNQQALVTAIAELLADPEKCQTLAEAAYRSVAHNTWSNRTEIIVSYYKKICQK